MLDHLGQLVGALVTACYLRAQITDILCNVSYRIRVVGQDVCEFSFHEHAFAHQLHVIEQHALLADVFRERRHRARRDAADVCVVAASGNIEEGF